MHVTLTSTARMYYLVYSNYAESPKTNATAIDSATADDAAR